MAFIVTAQPDEEVYLQREFRGSHQHVFAMAVSNQALYLSAQKWALKDDWYFKRVPLGEVKDMRLIKQKPAFIWLASLLMIGFGGLLSFLMLWNVFEPTPGVRSRVSGWPIAIFVGGFVVPFIARGRRTLLVRMKQGKFKWRPQLAIDKKTRELCAAIQNELLAACKKAGIQTSDS
jgi:hypothetical protein